MKYCTIGRVFVKIRTGSDFAGRTVKEWLYSNGFSRGHITKLKNQSDGITVNGERVTVRYILRLGDELCVASEDSAESENENLIPTEMPLDIIYEDEDMIAVNKPGDMPTHPSIGHFADTLANGLAYYFKAQGKPFVFRAINRLDRETSGVVLVAKNRIIANRLSGLMKAGKIRKTYIAVLNGSLTPQNGQIETGIRRCDEGIILRTVCSSDDPRGRLAVTAYKTAASSGDASVVYAEPITGRTHQLRVHFSHMGAPIVGDSFYGSAESTPTMYDRMISRQALHAAELRLELSQNTVVIKAPPPADMHPLFLKVQGENKFNEL